MKARTISLSLLLILMVAGCGGNSGNNNSPSTVNLPSLQGAFTGPINGGMQYNTLILADGSFWSYYGTYSGSVFIPSGVDLGTITSKNGAWSGGFSSYYHGVFSMDYDNVQGTYTTSTLIGTASEDAFSKQLNLTTPATTVYEYGKPALISTVVGTWSGGTAFGSTDSWTILSDGTFSGQSAMNCTYTGTFKPRSDGVNVFDFSITYGAAPCASPTVPGQQEIGIAVAFTLSDGQTELVAIGLDSTTTLISADLYGVKN